LVFYFFAANSVELMFAAQIGHGFFYGITIPILWAMIADVADYSEWKNNRRATAIIFSAMMVGLKGGLTIGSFLLTSILGAYGYITKEGAEASGIANELITQPESAIEGTRMLVSIYPSIPFLIGCGILFFYKINKNMEIQIEKELKQRRAQ
jgi:Na+/melibiose symporter-like transporter